jgi:tetratricopeptide (TPR) repeat protein
MMQELTDAPFRTKEAEQFYNKMFTAWSNGDQKKTEELMAEAAQKYKKDIRFAFFAAALIRCNFEVEEALPIFKAIAKAPPSRQQKAAEYMVALDTGIGIDTIADFRKTFDGLGKLALKQSPEDPIVIWLFGIACRTYHQSKSGVLAYTTLMKHLKVGTAIVHQTFANHLVDEKRYEEALPHRRLAVKLQPTGWTYDGLANTLFKLGKKEESEKIRKEAAVKYGDYPLFWINWGKELIDLKRYPEAIIKIEKALAFVPNDADAINARGWARYKMGKPEEGLADFRKAMSLNDHFPLAMTNAIEVLELLGRKDEAQALQKRLDGLSKK